MPNQPRLKVIKVPLDYVPEFKPINFSPMPRLYLEYLENKVKVKPELRNKEYIPKFVSMTPSYNVPSFQEANTYVENENTKEDKTSPINSVSNSREKINSRDEKKLQILDISKMSEKDIEELAQKKKEKRANENIYRYKKANNIVEKELSDNDDFIGYSEYKKPQESETKLPEEKKPKVEQPKEEENLINLLKGKDVVPESRTKEDKTPTPLYVQSTEQTNVVNNNVSNTKPTINLPPSISEINSGKVFSSQIRDLSSTIVNEDELSRKRKILSDFKRIKKMDKDITIPEFSELTDINTLEREYANIVKNLHIDSNVENYKKWLTMGFVGLEFFLTSIMKFDDIKGFSSAQMTNMNQYEKILVEIGEKSYVPEEKRLAPELRLIGIIMMNAAIFVGTKMLFKSTGNSMLNMMNGGGSQDVGGMFGAFSNMNNTTSDSSSNNTKSKKKMPGPNIDLNDLNFKKNE